jgi:hypothetical protein
LQGNPWARTDISAGLPMMPDNSHADRISAKTHPPGESYSHKVNGITMNQGLKNNTMIIRVLQ